MISAAKKFLFVLAFFLVSCSSETRINGQTMGTTWSVVVAGDADREILQKEISKELERLENIFSNWKDQSDLSRFNREKSVKPFEIGRDFYIVMNVALQVARRSNGAFDPAISGLIENAGFGTSDKTGKTSPAADSWKKVQVMQKTGKYYIIKSDPALALNLGAVAKGYAVDAIYLLLKLKKHDNFLVEIGGEVRTAGYSASNRPWKVGIEEPHPEKNEIRRVLHLAEMSVATSGGYRNFRTENGQTNIHILDPKTGKSVKNDILSVSIVNANCTYADAIATAFMVLGREQGMQLVHSFQGTDALVFYKDGDSVKEQKTPGMEAYLQ